jgi:aldose 1-epimerase
MPHQTLTLTSPDGATEADFVPGANLLCCSLRHADGEWLDQGGGVAAYAEHGKTMGIPLLYPWANRLGEFGYEAAGKTVSLPQGDPRIPVDPAGLPIHGVLPGLLSWELADQPHGAALSARLAWDRDELLDLFPFPHEVGVEVTVGEGELTIETTVRASEGSAVPVSFGYHPYFRIPDSHREGWQMELGAFRRLILDDHMIPTGEREPIGARHVELGESSWDDGFDGLASPSQFELAGDESRLTADFQHGYAFAQVYAPPGKDFVCFEPMTAPTNALRSGDGLQVVAPGAEYRSGFAVRIEGPARADASAN